MTKLKQAIAQGRRCPPPMFIGITPEALSRSAKNHAKVCLSILFYARASNRNVIRKYTPQINEYVAPE